MVTEVKELIRQRTWKRIPRDNVTLEKDGNKWQALKETWVFKLKHPPDGSPSNFKEGYCVRGDMQREGVEYFDTYAPVVQWSTIILLLTMVLSHELSAKQVDYTNAFTK